MFVYLYYLSVYICIIYLFIFVFIIYMILISTSLLYQITITRNDNYPRSVTDNIGSTIYNTFSLVQKAE